ncbi:hypothetical protein A8924_2035 [Saccharopolyspora erythraea NRRL 2338]|uniref:Uncharacterized protein n=2 Tax=Saccharopolyspora erythraea TaxID=1836 RepID=A4FA75_SACEN|nr:hypothetical protein [Saccharopolyspora erythraea]EQD83419.1 hypothetical protein N599_25425 [Saccharopolyspora erythraea D]PFG94736.1 hypothetical protein A8924_2035 [Saccharopolyspora erythraea NRRL 2338]QRK91458.1 hypothetical protein JQX30_08735 [Saccharopolyspora erythraea]CAM00950.1 hypothetical protein SACE_1631 [Saccharopolyspora erythraea NRRL 2338]
MSWHDFYRRQSAIQAVLDHATAHPSDELALEAVPQASEVFATTGELLRALHYKWTQLLTGRIGIALADADADPRVDRVQAVTTAWRRTAAGNPDLRAVLDRHAGAPALRPALEREQRMLALASGLAEHSEPDEEISRVGAAFLSLMRGTPKHTERSTCALRLRKLIPSS